MGRNNTHSGLRGAEAQTNEVSYDSESRVDGQVLTHVLRFSFILKFIQDMNRFIFIKKKGSEAKEIKAILAMFHLKRPQQLNSRQGCHKSMSRTSVS